MTAYEHLRRMQGMMILDVREHDELAVVYLKAPGRRVTRWLAFSPTGTVSELAEGCQILRDIERARLVAS